MQGRLQQLLQHPKAALVIFLIAMVLVLPSLAAGLLADDYALLLRLLYPELAPAKAYPSIADLFALIHVGDEAWRQQQKAYSLLPWWTSDELQVVFFRPLAELSHLLDSRLWPQLPFMMHVHNLVWYAAMLVALYAVYRRLMPHKSLAVLALLFFAVDATHGFTVAWIANRNALMAGVFVLLAFKSFIDARQRPDWLDSVLSLVFAAFALLCAEMGVSFIGFFVLYIVLLDQDKTTQKYLSLLPSVVLLAVWLGFYCHFNFGAKGSFYIDPLSQPLDFLAILPERIFTAIAMQFNLLPLHLMDRFPIAVVFIGIGIFILLLLFVMWQKTRLATFLLAAFIVCLLPVSAALMQERNLLIAGFAGCGLQALILQQLWQVDVWWARLVSWLIVIFHLLISALLMLPMSFAPWLLNKPAEKSALLMPTIIEQQTVVAIGAPLYSSVFAMLIRQKHGDVLPTRFWHLTSFQDVTIEQLAANQWRVSREEGLLHKEDFLVRNLQQDPLQIGQVIDINGANITIEAINAKAIPTAIVLTLNKPQNSPLWMLWQGQQWQLVNPASFVSTNNNNEERP